MRYSSNRRARLAARGTRRFLASFLVLAPVSLLLVSCSSYQLARAVLPIAEEGKPVPELEKLCKTEGGVHVYQQPPSAEGFVLKPETDYLHGPDQPATDQGWGGCSLNECLRYLIDYGYDFVEAQYNDTPDALPRDFADSVDRRDDSGLYRYRLVPREERQCKTFDWLVKHDVAGFSYRVRDRKAQLGDRCIVAERIPGFTARYQVERNTIIRAQPDYDGTSGGFLTEYQHVIRDRETGEIMVKGSGFSYQNLSYINKHLGNCISDDVNIFEFWKYLPPVGSRAAQRD